MRAYRNLFSLTALAAGMMASLRFNMAEDSAAGGVATAEPAKPEIPVGARTNADFSFFFRTEKIRDNEGKVIGNGRKHPDVKATVPIPTYEQLVGYLQQGGKEAELILESATDSIYNAARQQINEWREDKGSEATFTANDLDLSKLSLTAIANMPKSERGGPAISEEDWTAFLEDYKNVMVNVVGYEAKKVDLAVMHFKVQLRRIKNDKPAVGKLLELLNLWATKTENLEDHTVVFEDLLKRAKKYLTAEEKNVAEAL